MRHAWAMRLQCCTGKCRWGGISGADWRTNLQVHRYREPGRNRWGRRDSCVIWFEHPLLPTSCSRQEKHLPPPQGYTGTSRIVPHNQLLIEISVLNVRRCDLAHVWKVDFHRCILRTVNWVAAKKQQQRAQTPVMNDATLRQWPWPLHIASSTH